MNIFFYLGIYTLIDVVNNGVPNNVSENLLFTTLGYIILCILLLYLFSKIFIFNNYQLLELRYVVSKFETLKLKHGLILLFIISVITIYTYIKYGLLGRGDVALLTVSLPYYLSSLRYIIPTISFMLCLVAFTKLLGNKENKVMWSLIGLLSFIISFIYGRRIVFCIILVLAVIYIIKSSAGKTKIFLSILLLSIVMLMTSNLFQNYRYLIYDMNSTYNTAPSFSESLFNIDTTTSNLKERTAMWKLNYLVNERKVTGHYYNEPGILLYEGIKNAIPSAIWKDKKVTDLDTILANNLNLPVTDYPSNIFAFIHFDFGFNGVFIFCLIILLFLIISIFILSTLKNTVVPFCLVYSNVLINFMNIENTYTSLFTMLRDNLIIASLAVVLITIFRSKQYNRVMLHQ